MQGLLIKPVGCEPDRRYPLVMWVHGGPTGVSGSRFYAAFGWNQLLANAGYAVFLPNYRGSVGWGLEFAESNIGDMGGGDFDDMMRGVDSLVAAGVADPDRLAIAGWSYGGFTAAWGVAQTNRFCAAVMGAGISLWANALAALRAVGALEPVLAVGEAMRRGELRDWRGRVMQALDPARLEPPDGLPAIQMAHRAELLGALLAQLPAGVVR